MPLRKPYRTKKNLSRRRRSKKDLKTRRRKNVGGWIVPNSNSSKLMNLLDRLEDKFELAEFYLVRRYSRIDTWQGDTEVYRKMSEERYNRLAHGEIIRLMREIQEITEEVKPKHSISPFTMNPAYGENDFCTIVTECLRYLDDLIEAKEKAARYGIGHYVGRESGIVTVREKYTIVSQKGQNLCNLFNNREDIFPRADTSTSVPV